MLGFNGTLYFMFDIHIQCNIIKHFKLYTFPSRSLQVQTSNLVVKYIKILQFSLIW